MYNKITHGYVRQMFDENGTCIRQEFEPDGDVQKFETIPEAWGESGAF